MAIDVGDVERPDASLPAGWPGVGSSAPSPAAVPAFMNSLRLNALLSGLFIPPPFFSIQPEKKNQSHPRGFYITAGKNRKARQVEKILSSLDKIKMNINYEEIVSDVYGLYSRLKFQQSRFEPDLEYIGKYEEAYERIQKRNIAALRERRTTDIIRQLREKEKALPKPIPLESELFGWMKLVYERIPSGAFRTSDMYQYEKEFQRIYPENRNIKAKIRQQLQFLRDSCVSLQFRRQGMLIEAG